MPATTWVRPAPWSAPGDNQNTVRDLATYSSGTGVTSVVNHRVFSAYGQLLSQTNAAAADCLFAYTGRAMSRFSTDSITGAVTGIQNNGDRWYNSITGRWLTDPSGFQGRDANLYRYCGNGPVNATDPTGLGTIHVSPWTTAGSPQSHNPPFGSVTGIPNISETWNGHSGWVQISNAYFWWPGRWQIVIVCTKPHNTVYGFFIGNLTTHGPNAVRIPDVTGFTDAPPGNYPNVHLEPSGLSGPLGGQMGTGTLRRICSLDTDSDRESRQFCH